MAGRESPPYFTALALWYIGGTYATGGFFPDARSIWHGYSKNAPDLGELPRWLVIRESPPPYIDRTAEWPERTVFVNRLLRDGWTRAEAGPEEVWEHPHRDRQLTLLLLDRAADFHAYGGRYRSEYAVRAEPDLELYPLGQATWADWDQQGRLVLAQGGRLLTWTPPDIVEEIADFNPQTPESVATPSWAQTWP